MGNPTSTDSVILEGSIKGSPHFQRLQNHEVPSAKKLSASDTLLKYRKVGYGFLRLGHCFPRGLGTKYGRLRTRRLWLGEFHIQAYILSGCVRYCKRGPISRPVHSNEVFSAHVQSSTTGPFNPKPLAHLRALKLNRAFKPDSPSMSQPCNVDPYFCWDNGKEHGNYNITIGLGFRG